MRNWSRKLDFNFSGLLLGVLTFGLSDLFFEGTFALAF